MRYTAFESTDHSDSRNLYDYIFPTFEEVKNEDNRLEHHYFSASFIEYLFANGIIKECVNILDEY